VEISKRSSQIIAIYPNRYSLLIVHCVIVLCFLLFLGIDSFILWAFWTNYHIDAGASVAAVFAVLATIFIGGMLWWLIQMRSKWRKGDPLMMINAQGLSIDFKVGLGKIFVPWEEIAWIAGCRVNNVFLYFSICLKDGPHWWMLYGNGRSRTIRRDPLTQAHLHVPQAMLGTPVKQVLSLIEQHYAEELARYHVHLLL